MVSSPVDLSSVITTLHSTAVQVVVFEKYFAKRLYSVQRIFFCLLFLSEKTTLKRSLAVTDKRFEHSHAPFSQLWFASDLREFGLLCRKDVFLFIPSLVAIGRGALVWVIPT